MHVKVILINNKTIGEFTNLRKVGSDDLSLRAGFMASNQAGKPPKSHSAIKYILKSSINGNNKNE